MSNQHDHKQSSQSGHSHHHIIPNKTIFTVGGILLVLTGITVAVAHVDLGAMNFVVAMLVASIKALLVALIFMNLYYDKKENGIIFATAFVFLAIFMVLTATDLFFRGDVYLKGPIQMAQSKSKLKNPWVSTSSLVSHGKELFALQCASCHGVEGKGNGPAAGGFKLPPRNFTETANWVNGRKSTQVFATLKNGLARAGGGMPAFASLPSDDRWALAHYVISLNSSQPGEITVADFKAAGVDPSGASAPEEKTISLDLAIERMSVKSAEANSHLYASAEAFESATGGAKIYGAQCIQCHGAKGEGAIKVKTLSVLPPVFVTTQPMRGYSSMGSQDAFNRIVVRGLPGESMPGNGQLSADELRELYQFVKSIR